MKHQVITIFDSDQYSLNKCLNEDDIQNSYLLACSNNQKNVIYDDEIMGTVVPILPEATDTYIVSKLSLLLNRYDIKLIVIASRDKKLIHMLLCLIDSIGGISARFHECCKYDIQFELNEFQHLIRGKRSKRKSKLNGFEQHLLDHISQFPYGLRVDTLSCHYNIPKDKMANIVNQLEKAKYLKKLSNAYCSH